MNEATPTFLARAWRGLLYGGAASAAVRDQVYVINVYSIIGFLALFIFGLLHIFVEENGVLGELELAGSAVIAVNALSLRITRDVALARTFFILSILLVLFVMLATGGTRGTGIFWIFVFPSIAFFLAGKRWGFWWLGGLYAMILAVLAFSRLSLLHTPYSFIELRQLLVSLGVVAIGIFVFERARENALIEVQESRRDLQEYLDHMTTFSVKIGVDGRVLFANKIAKETSPFASGVVGTDFLNGGWWTFDEAVRRRVEAAFFKALSGKPVNYDEQMRVVTPGGGSELVTVNFSMMPIFAGKRIKYVLAEGRDISAEQEVDRAKSEFVALASHQLRTPISAIAWYAEMLLSGNTGHLSPEQRSSIQQIYGSNKRMAALINDMLLVANLDLGSLPVAPTYHAISELIGSAVSEVKAAFLKGRKLEIAEDYAADLPSVAVDPDVIRILLRNLLSNAIKYTPDDGRVTVRVSHTEGRVHPTSKGSIQIEVQDNGLGIPESAQAKLFTKFFRGQNVQPKDTDGTGLGLYVVKSLLQYVGGAVSFSSKEHVGTIFTILLPLEGMRTHGQAGGTHV